MPSNKTWVCVPCRTTARHAYTAGCPHCGAEMTSTGKRWRPPRRSDDKAWAQVAQGNLLTEPAPARAGRGVPYAFTGAATPTPGLARTRRDVAMEALGRLLRSDPGPEREAQLLEWTRWPDVAIRLQMARWRDAPPAVVARLTRDSDPEVRAGAFSHAAFDPTTAAGRSALRRGARDKDARVRATVASRAVSQPRLLAALARDKHHAVVRTAAANPGLGPGALVNLPLCLIPAGRDAELAAHALPGLPADAAARLLASLRGPDPGSASPTSHPLTAAQALDAAAAVLA